MTGAVIYRRNNRQFGASCDGTNDTGHAIEEQDGRFTIWSVHDEDQKICDGATRAAAEAAIAEDWRRT